MFDKRFKVYQATRDLLRHVEQEEVDLKELDKFEENTVEAVFLFDENISKYLCKIYFKSKELKGIDYKLSNLDKLLPKKSEEEKEGILGKHEELYNWLIDQPEELQKVFSPYLKFKVWK